MKKAEKIEIILSENLTIAFHTLSMDKKWWCKKNEAIAIARGHSIQLCIVNDSQNWSGFWLKIGLVHSFI